MGLETGTYINSLNVSNPLGTDQKSTVDDHIRLLKATIKATFPNITGAVTATQAQLNTLPVITAFAGTLLDDADNTTARATLGAAKSGVNGDITSLTGLTTPLSVAQGGTGGNTQAASLTALGAALNAVDAKTAAYTVIAADRGKLIDATTGTWTLTLTAAATLGAGFVVGVRNSGTGVITIDPNASEQIDGATTIALAAGESCVCVCTGTAWKTVGRSTTAPQLRAVIFGSGSGNWVVPVGVTAIEAVVIAGGGGGGGASSHRGGNGGDGGVAHGFYSVTPGQSLSYTIGSGGAGFNGYGNGGSGSASSLGSLLSATGGGGGLVGAGSVGAAGTAGVGTGGTLGAGNASTQVGFPGATARAGGAGLTAAISWSAGGGRSPGAGGTGEGYSMDSPLTNASGGVGGAILIRYVGA